MKPLNRKPDDGLGSTVVGVQAKPSRVQDSPSIYTLFWVLGLRSTNHTFLRLFGVIGNEKADHQPETLKPETLYSISGNPKGTL